MTDETDTPCHPTPLPDISRHFQTTDKKPRGHWPRGKRRNQDAGDWEQTRTLLETILRDHHAPMIRSTPVLAAITGVSVSAVVRWIRAEAIPTPANQAVLSEWANQTAATLPDARK
jgi:hypothetical protein